MAQLLIKKSSWWEFNAKQAIIWLPVAAVQASTLAGLGYFYHRLNELEAPPAVPPQPLLANTLQDVAPPTPTVRTSRIPPPLPPVPAPIPVALQVRLASSATQDVMRVGQDFATAEKPAVTKPPKPAVKNKTTDASKEHVSKKNVPDAVMETTFVSLDPTAEANLAALPAPADLETAANADMAVVVIEPVPESAPDATIAVDSEIVPHRTAPVGVSKWVYLGELRDYGWHGQKLRIPSDSGLPEEGGTYHTQQIHGLYDEPHGRRVMGGFQLGDTVTVQKVRQEENGGVWAEVRKVRSVGKPGCVTCTQ
ncbi:MAG: hypothetical protein BWK73_31230 [Thiothrix lacustris]|uniref:Uncharacterized protein n=1 Tax=Thiothrix lacustris TaxID=525917 RepID=A0A1Y1QI95_9GAMM|nr:MAG: hypothetical protein BWK73_31230 [Thiothrix lacustris]